MSSRPLFLLLLAALTLVRWMWGAPRDLSPEEAYLALCGLIPAPAYFDGPPGTPLAVAGGILLTGGGGFGANFFWPLFAAGATLLLYALAVPLAGPPAALGAAVLFNLLPVFNEAALAPTCAMPLAMFSLGFLAAAWRALERSSLAWWLAAGLCVAGGLLFAYEAWILWPALVLVLLASHRWRRHLLEPGIWLAAVPPLAVLGMLLAWNAGHGWVHFIGATWQSATTLDGRLLPGSLFAAMTGLTPFVLLVLTVAWFRASRSIRVAPRVKFLAVPATAAVLLAMYYSLRGQPAMTPGLTAAALAIPLLAWLPRWKFVLPAVFLGSALWTTFGIVRQPMPAPVVTGQVAARIDELRRSQTTDPAAPVFLIARDAPLASSLALYLPDVSFASPGHPPVYVVESPYSDSQYALWPRYDQFVDAPEPSLDEAPDPFTEQDGANPFVWRSALYITPQTADQLPQAITAAFASHRLLAEITTPSGQVLRVYLCSEYETLPL
ncbi:MAG: glycosyltransferase family 39 protein [Chthoniobacterales bacterium]